MRGARASVIAAASLVVFALLDLLDWALCFFYRFLDSFLEENPVPCYCRSGAGGGKPAQGITGNNGGDGRISETLFERRNIFREMGSLATDALFEKKRALFLHPVHCHCQSRAGREEKEQGIAGQDGGNREVFETLLERRNLFRDMGFLPRKGLSVQKVKKGGRRSPRWSDCGCESCCSWQWQGKEKEELHLVVREPLQESTSQAYAEDQIESVLFLHGFLSSSSLWVKTVFPNLSEAAKLRTRLFAVDLLGFGCSPKPADCFYTIDNHLKMIESSVIKHHRLNSFHVVAHSMGCIIALALAAKHPNSVKSITLVAPPYFSSVEGNASKKALEKLAERKIWPPLLFVSSVMSWYEHLGRTVCFIICRNHSIWERILKLLMWRRHLPFSITDMTKHTHHSAWHTMHNVICGGAELLDEWLETLQEKGTLIKILQGSRDQVVPLECSYNMKAKVPKADLNIINSADHASIILGREEAFTKDLEETWFSSC